MRRDDRRAGAACALVLAGALVPGVAAAQEPLPGWPGLRLEALATVYVRDETGVETRGRLLRVNPDSLDVLVEGVERRLDAARVRRIQARGDSLRNGAILGAVVGAAASLLTAGFADCPGDDPGRGCTGTRVAFGLIGTGVYTALGVAIDAAWVGRTTLYEAPPRTAGGGQDGRIAGRVLPGRRVAAGLRVQW